MAEEPEDPHDVDVYAPARHAGSRFVRLDAAQGIARITLNRPPANVLSVEVMEEINNILESLEYQRDVKLVVVTAVGKYFSAGFEIAEHLGDRAYLMLEEFHQVVGNLGQLDKPGLAAGAGPALGAGHNLAGARDKGVGGGG